MTIKEFTMHRTPLKDGEFCSENHSGMLQQMIKLLGFKFTVKQNKAYDVEWESYIVDRDNVYPLCDKLMLLGWRYLN